MIVGARRWRRGLAGIALVALTAAGAVGLGPLPPAGPLLDPFGGLWAVATTAEPPSRSRARLPGLGAPVRVVYDDRAVPHIFAATESDAYRALGYVIARDRLFQLDLQARAGGGTLTELLGPSLLPADRDTRATGFRRAAERILAGMAPSSAARQALDQYVAGVNAYMDGLGRRDLPLEYRLLGRRPARWTAADPIYVYLQMGRTLAWSGEEFTRLAAAARAGRAAADALFPVHAPLQEPIVPAPHEPRALADTIPPPGAPDSSALLAAETMPRVPSGSGFGRAARDPDADAPGSNNWAVAPRRTRNGFALLAGDPHLDLTLPSIWYEAQLAAPGLDVYGVTIPGLPAIIIGFNRDVAWSFTNTQADVLDYWRETVDDTLRPARYRVDGSWRPLETRLETYRDPRGRVLATDTLRFTHRGPLRRTAGRWLSFRWTVLEAGDLAAPLQRAAHARSAREWLDAMAPYQAPAQNMLVADGRGTIAIRSTGRFPRRPGDGRGDLVHDGGSSASDWTGAWPVSEEPQSVDPAQGFLASANQEPVDPVVNGAYLGADWFSPWRALRINQLLRADSSVTPDAMRRWQTDVASPRADRFAPFFIAAARAHAGDTLLAHAADVLARWDRRHTAGAAGATLFERAMDNMGPRLFDELSANGLPSAMIASRLLDEPDNVWWDVRATRTVERRDDVLAASLRAAYHALGAEHGAPERGGWAWARVHRANVPHLLRLPSLSAVDLPPPGGPSTLSPSEGAGDNGSSWRMVVELGPEVHGWGTYPGGQSGNPASTHYADYLPAWVAGRLDSLRFPHSPTQLRPSATLLLEGAR